MPALAQCDAFAFIYDQAGDPAADVLVVLKRVIDASGNPILLGPKTTLTDSAGSFHFTLPEAATAFISARASALWNCPDGLAFTVPPGPSGELIPSFSVPSSTTVEPPLVYVSDVLSIPKASAFQDGYLSAADFVAFEAGAGDMGVTSITAGTGLTGGTITEIGTIGLATIPGVAGTWPNPISITVNAQGQIIAIQSGAPDTTPPVITLDAPTLLLATSVTINWHTNEPADSLVEYGIGSYGLSAVDTLHVLDHHVALSGLTPLSAYQYRVKSSDIAGNPAIPVTSTFNTPIVTDTTPPIITLAGTPVTSITDTTATINWTTNENADSQVEYSTDLSYGTPTVPPIFDTTGVTTHIVALSSLAASTTYNYRVKSKDAAGNPATPVTGSFLTHAAPGADLLTNLLAYWKLDEAAGTGARLDSSGGGNSLTPAVALATSAGKSGFNLAARFVEDGNLLEAASGSFGAMGPSVNYTISVWAQVADKANDRGIVCKSGTAGLTDEYMVQYAHSATSGAGRWQFTIRAADNNYYSVTAADLGEPALNTWYLIVVWHETATTTLNIQVDSGAINSFVLVPPLAASLAMFHLGIYSVAGGGVGTNPHFGLIDEVGIWQNRMLNATERAALWAGGAGKPFDTW